MLFTDGSVNTKTKVGYGAYLAVFNIEYPLDMLLKKIMIKSFEHTSSTRLELQTLLWALNDIQIPVENVIVYTDSQNIIGLPERRFHLEENEYRSKKNKRLNNYELYQEFFTITDSLNCEFIKVSGHQVSNKKDHIDRVFTLVDQASRRALRGENR